MLTDLAIALGFPAIWCALYIFWYHVIRRPY